MSNTALDEYLKDFFSLTVPPGYAVMLDGEWGAGKSHYLKKMVVSLATQKRKPVYISLYGLKNTEEIDDAIFAELHPRLSDPKFKLLKKIAAGVLKSTIKIDIDSDTSINASLPTVEISESMKISGDYIFIFDDFERCNIPANELLGYINFFVEHLQLKTIIAANQIEVPHDPETVKVKYSALKEKVVGATFKIEPDFKGAFDVFLTEISPQSLVVELKKQESIIEKLFIESNYKNLRSLRSSLLDFQRIYQSLPSNAQTSEACLSELLEDFLPLSFELRKGALRPEEIDDFFGTWLSSILENANKSKNQENERPQVLEQLSKKYSSFRKIALSEQSNYFWIKLFQSGLVDKGLLTELVKSNPIFMAEDTPNWKKLWWWHNSTQTDFETYLAAVRAEISQKNFTNIYEVMHVYSTLFTLAEKRFLKHASLKTLLEEAEKYILSLSKNQLLINEDASCELDFSRGYDGLGYNREQLEFVKLRKFVRDIGAKQQSQIDEDYANKLVELFSNDGNEFSRQLADLNGRASRIPVFKYINATELMRSAKKFSKARDWENVAWGFKERFKYSNSDWVDRFVEEISFFKLLDKLLLQQAIRTKRKLVNDGILSFQQVTQEILQKFTQRENQLKSVQLTEKI